MSQAIQRPMPGLALGVRVRQPEGWAFDARLTRAVAERLATMMCAFEAPAGC
jgi:hypothetical protein